MAAKPKTLQDAFYETLKDVYYAEKQSVRALKKSAKAAEHEDLKRAFETHAEESANQVERLQQVFEIIGKPQRSKTCEAMQGLTSEMEEDLEDFGDSPAADAVLVGCAQALEHYEIARYGTLKTWASQLGHEDAAKLLDETLQEEKKTDEILSPGRPTVAGPEERPADGRGTGTGGRKAAGSERGPRPSKVGGALAGVRRGRITAYRRRIRNPRGGHRLGPPDGRGGSRGNRRRHSTRGTG